MEYISCAEVAAKWGISERRVQKLCEGERIPGAVKFSRIWLIPKDAEKPFDRRKYIKLCKLFRWHSYYYYVSRECFV